MKAIIIDNKNLSGNICKEQEKSGLQIGDEFKYHPIASNAVAYKNDKNEVFIIYTWNINKTK